MTGAENFISVRSVHCPKAAVAGASKTHALSTPTLSGDHILENIILDNFIGSLLSDQPGRGFDLSFRTFGLRCPQMESASAFPAKSARETPLKTGVRAALADPPTESRDISSIESRDRARSRSRKDPISTVIGRRPRHFRFVHLRFVMIEDVKAEAESSSPAADDVQADRSWPYTDVASLPVPSSVEDHMLTGLRTLTSSLDVERVCAAVLAGVEQVFGATSSWILLHDPGKNVLRSALFRGRAADVYRDLEIPADRGIAGMVFTNRRIQFVADVAAERRWYNPDRIRGSGLTSVVILPLVAGDRTLGVLGLDSPAFGPSQPPGLTDVKRLEIFAAQAAVGLLNARLYTSSQQDRARLRALLQERRALRQQLVELRDEVRHAYSFGPIVGESASMRTVLEELEQVCGCDVTVLLLGETGTGKELLARAVHERSRRAARPFVPVNCAALPETLVESELFGYERGAFTGAHTRKPGKFELAHRGTLFLDEIGDLPQNAQAKLLRVLQDGEVHRVGGTQPLKVDVRIIAATHQDLSARVADGSFRSDLYYRLSVFPLRIPPLRDRPGDVPLLAKHLLLPSARRLGKRITGMTEEALEALSSYSWPGNVRELQNVLERAVILARDDVVAVDAIRLGPLDTPPQPPPAAIDRMPPPAANETAPPDPGEKTPRTLVDAERAVILQALRHAEGRVSGPRGAAALLGLKPTTLHAKMKKLGVHRRDVLKG